jgi:hypothetical protein
MFGVFGVCDPWRGAQHTSCKDGGAIMKWLVPINLIEVRSFVGASQYLQKFIASFSVVDAPLHAIKRSGKSL